MLDKITLLPKTVSQFLTPNFNYVDLARKQIFLWEAVLTKLADRYETRHKRP